MRSACICQSLGVPISHLPSTPSTWFCSPEIDNFVYRLRFLLWFFQTRLQARIEPCHSSTCIVYLLELMNMKSECVPGCHVYHKNCSLGHSLWSMLPTWLTFSGSFSIKPSFMLLHAKYIHHSCVPFHFASPFCTSCLFFASFAVSHLGDSIISVLLIFITCLLPHFPQYIRVSGETLPLPLHADLNIHYSYAFIPRHHVMQQWWLSKFDSFVFNNKNYDPPYEWEILELHKQ